MLFRDSYKKKSFDACVKTGYCKGSAKLVSIVSNFDSPSPGTAQAFSLTTFSPRRVSCSLSALLGVPVCKWGLVDRPMKPKPAGIKARHHGRTQRTEASPCAVRTRDKEHCSLNAAESSTLRICRQSISAGDAPSPSKAHVQTLNQRSYFGSARL